MSRTIDSEYEVNASAHGMPADLVPQTVERREIRVSRYDLYPLIMEEVFGTTELITLADQASPFVVRERWVGPAFDLLGASQDLLGLAPGIVSGVPGNLGSQAQNAIASAIQPASTAVTQALTGRVGSAVVNTLGFISQDIRAYEYSGCYFTDLGRQIDAKGDRVVSVEATLTWLSRRRVQ